MGGSAFTPPTRTVGCVTVYDGATYTREVRGQFEDCRGTMHMTQRIND